MPDTETLTEEQLERALKDFNEGADLAACHIPALCRSLRAARAEIERMPLAQSALRRLDELRAANERALSENAELRQQLATQAESIIEFQENEKSLKAQLAQAVTLTKREARILTDYHYHEAEKAITRWGCKAAQRAHLERLAELRKTYEPTG